MLIIFGKKSFSSCLLALFFASNVIVAQADLPEKPIITFVTTDTSSNAIKIYWNPSSSTDVVSYCVYTLDITTNPVTGTFLDTVPADSLMYIHYRDKLVSYIYSITAVDSKGNESLLGGDFHKPVKLDIVYDSCTNSMKVSWNKYIGWKYNLTGYKIFMQNDANSSEEKQSDDGNGFQLVYNMIDTSKTEYIVDDIRDNEAYKFYIQAYDNRGRNSLSNIRSEYTEMPLPPSFLSLDYVSVLDQRSVEISFSTEIGGEINDFRISKSTAIDANYTAIKTVSDLTQSSYVLTDEIITQKDHYFYIVEAMNSCNQPILQSNPGSNIFLQKDTVIGPNVSIKWTEYEQYGSGGLEYRIYRKNSTGEPEYVTSKPEGTTTFSENISEISGSKIKGSVTYAVEAIELGTNPLGESGVSRSNEVIIDVTTSLFIPNAFTPNDDHKNDFFLPVFDFIPEEYKMFIYDPSGKVLFSSNDPTAGWDGTVNGGIKAQEGVYVYHIEYRSYDFTGDERTGTVTLIYP